MKEVGDVWGEIQSLTPHCHLYILGAPFRGSTWDAVLLVQPVGQFCGSSEIYTSLN